MFRGRNSTFCPYDNSDGGTYNTSVFLRKIEVLLRVMLVCLYVGDGVEIAFLPPGGALLLDRAV